MSDDNLPLIEVDRLRAGMFIHLDVGWQKHPFPFNSFKLRSVDQIDTLRSLGLGQVRWSPERSDVGPLPLPGEAEPVPSPAPVSPPEPAPNPAESAVRERLRRQQAELYRCETRVLDIGRQFRHLQHNLRRDPDAAREEAEHAVATMSADIEGEGEVAIRLLSERVGDEGASHSVNVAVLSLLLARACGLPPEGLRDAAIGGLLHDVGKLDLPGYLQVVSRDLAEHEQRALHKHVEFGVEAGRRMGLGRGALRAIAEHHEHSDGSGYPQALKGEAISPLGRIVGLANHYDSLVNPGGDLPGMTPHEALAQMYARQRSLFDERTLGLFVRMMGIYPPGSLVELGDHRLGLVLAANPDIPLRPRIALLDGTTDLDEVPLLDLAQASEVAILRSLRPERLPPAQQAQMAGWRRRAYYFAQAEPGAGKG